MRSYFKELKINMQRIEETKIARLKSVDGSKPKAKKKKKAAKKAWKNQINN